MKKKLTGWSVVALIAAVAMLLCEQNVQAQCAGGARSPGLAAGGQRGNAPQGFGRQGGMIQAMEMVQRAQQMMRLQQQMVQRQQQLRGRQQPTTQNMNNTFARQNMITQGNFLAKSNASVKSKPALNPDSPKAKRIARLKARKEARQKEKADALAKRKAERANRIAEFKQQQANSR